MSGPEEDLPLPEGEANAADVERSPSAAASEPPLSPTVLDIAHVADAVGAADVQEAGPRISEIDRLEAAAVANGRGRRASRGSVRLSIAAMEQERGHQGAATTVAGTAQEVKMFVNIDDVKQKAHDALVHGTEYDVSRYYKETGCAREIAMSSAFQSVTLVAITINAFWIGFDVQVNTAPTLAGAKWYFQVGEYSFCAFFTSELMVRFLAFQSKRNCLRDFWFVFDSLLVGLMLGETFVLPQILTTMASQGGGTNLSQLSMLRMLRLLRLTRMVRLMRAVPELVTLIRSMSLAARSVISTLLLLFLFVYIFAIIVRSQFKPTGNAYLETRFDHLQDIMWNLLMRAAFLDGPRTVGQNIMEVNTLFILVWIIFIWISALMILNMLVGLLCDVVEAVAAAEREKAMVSYVKSRLMSVLKQLDTDGNKQISRTEFLQLMTNKNDEFVEAKQSLQELGVDVENLISLADHLFPAPEAESQIRRSSRSASEGQSPSSSRLSGDSNSESTVDEASGQGELPQEETEEEEEVQLEWGQFLEMIIKLRASHKPSVADMVEVRKLFMGGHHKLTARLESMEATASKMAQELKGVQRTLEKMNSKEHMGALMSWVAEGLRHAKAEAAEELRQRDSMNGGLPLPLSKRSRGRRRTNDSAIAAPARAESPTSSSTMAGNGSVCSGVASDLGSGICRMASLDPDDDRGVRPLASDGPLAFGSSDPTRSDSTRNDDCGTSSADSRRTPAGAADARPGDPT